MAQRIFEHIGFVAHAATISSASTLFTIPMCVEGTDEISYLLGMGTAAGGVNTTVHIVQAASADSTSWAQIAGATAITLGSTNATVVGPARQVLITITTATTDGDVLVINGEQFTQSTANAAATVTTGFGSTAGATGADGAGPIVASLASAINNSTVAALQGLTAATASTATCRIVVDDTASTYITLGATAASPISFVQEQSEAYVSIPTAMLNSTSRFVRAMFSSAATSVHIGAVGMKIPNHYNPPPRHGVYTNVKAT